MEKGTKSAVYISGAGPAGLAAALTIAVGYVFDTDLADGAFAAVSDRLAPKGYSYFLVHKGRGTVATCFFEDYHNEKIYLERTVALFQEKAGLRMRNERKFGGTGNFLVPRAAQKGNILLAGEAAGFQDALWGFGMRYAMLSGHLAARALLAGKPEDYDSLWKRWVGGPMRTGIVNRYLFEKLGDKGYKRFLRKAYRNRDVRAWLRSFYAVTWWKSLLFPIAEPQSVPAAKKPHARWKAATARGAAASMGPRPECSRPHHRRCGEGGTIRSRTSRNEGGNRSS